LFVSGIFHETFSVKDFPQRDAPWVRRLLEYALLNIRGGGGGQGWKVSLVDKGGLL
jgi:hypothetical protein